MKKKVLFLIHDLGGGGAERVLVNLVNHMDQERYDITVQTVFRGGVNAKLLHENITYRCSKAKSIPGSSFVYKFFPARILYKQFIGNKYYDLMIAYRSGIPSKIISGCPDENVGKLTWIHYGDSRHSLYFMPWMLKKSAFKAYSKFDRVVAVAQTAAKSFSEYTGIQTVEVVYNTNDSERIRQLMDLDINDCVQMYETSITHLVAVGRLMPQKGFDRLISIISDLRKNDYNIDLTIVGEGVERERLEQQVKDLGLDGIVRLPGFTDNPYSYMKHADLLVCSSREEGLSTVITEALIIGTPVVSTDVSGAKEVLGFHNEFGIVTGNSEEQLRQGICKLLDNSQLLAHYKMKAQERGTQFSTAQTVDEAQKLFDAIIAKKSLLK